MHLILPGSAAAAVQSSLHAFGIQAPPPPGGAASSSSGGSNAPTSALPLAGSTLPLPPLQLPDPAGMLLGASQQQPQPQRRPPPPAAGPAAQAAGEDKEVARALLRHERQLQRLRRQNRALRGALCRVDPKAPVCDAKRGGWDDSSSEGARGETLQ